MVSCLAQSTLNIHQKDGAIISYGFAEKPIVTYTGTSIRLTTSKVEVDYPLANLDKFTFGDNDSSQIEVLRTESTNDDMYIYNTNGVLVKSIRLIDGTSSFQTSELPKGIYIIKNGKTTYKITKR